MINNYKIPAPRVLFRLTAFALTALTLGLSVVAPAGMDAGAPAASGLTAARNGASNPVDVIINPARIDVIGVREPTVS